MGCYAYGVDPGVLSTVYPQYCVQLKPELALASLGALLVLAAWTFPETLLKVGVVCS